MASRIRRVEKLAKVSVVVTEATEQSRSGMVYSKLTTLRMFVMVFLRMWGGFLRCALLGSAGGDICEHFAF